MKLEFYTGILNGSEEHMWKFSGVSTIWSQITVEKEGWDLSHFYCGKVNVIIPYMVLFSSYGFQTLHRVTRNQSVCEKFLRFGPFGPELWGESFFLNIGLFAQCI